jgi:hypothetical protein
MIEDANYLVVQKVLRRDEKYCRRMDRCITEISILTGMGFTDILDFLQFGADTELKELDESFDWTHFRKKISARLKGKSIPEVL